jgi:WD40 repeat protein
LSIVVNREQVQDIEPLSELQCHRAVVTSLTSCQLDGRNTLITTSEDGTVALHSVDQKVGMLKGHRATVTSAAFLSWNDQPMILTGSLDSTVQLWEFRGWFKGWTSVLTIMYDSPVLSAAHDLVNGVELVYASCANGEVNVCELAMSDSGSLISRSATPLRGQREGEVYVVMKRSLDVSTSVEGDHIIGSLRQGTAFNAVASQAQRTSNDINTDTMTDRNVCFQFVSNPGPPAVIICT